MEKTEIENVRKDCHSDSISDLYLLPMRCATDMRNKLGCRLRFHTQYRRLTEISLLREPEREGNGITREPLSRTRFLS